MPKYSVRSAKILKLAHEDLQELFEEVIKIYDCTIICSVRDAEAQQKAFDDGLSKAKPGQSPHNFNPSFAVDVVPTAILGSPILDSANKPRKYPDGTSMLLDWNAKDKEVQSAVAHEMIHFAGVVKGVAAAHGLKIRWGGDFKSFKDMPHWELLDWETLKPRKI